MDSVLLINERGGGADPEYFDERMVKLARDMEVIDAD